MRSIQNVHFKQLIGLVNSLANEANKLVNKIILHNKRTKLGSSSRCKKMGKNYKQKYRRMEKY